MSDASSGSGGDSRLGPGAEFDLIRTLRATWGARAQGIGDDAALLRIPPDEEIVVSTDVSVDRVHFRQDWMSPREIGYRATTAALSDLAAVGATPRGVLLALTLPRDWLPNAPDLAQGVGEAVERADTVVVGGDLSRGHELSLSVTVIGSTRRPLLRSAACAGDGVFLTGVLGGPALAIEAWSVGAPPAAHVHERFVHPTARIREARWLADAGAHAAIDISDGILADAAHVAAASGVRIVLELDRLPLWPGATLQSAVRSGEEYELLVTAPTPLDVSAFERTFALPLTHIGRVEAGASEVVPLANGARVAWPGGFDHFS